MKYGYFDDAAREYVITRPDTPQPWFNYIRNEDWCGLISNTGGGTSFHKDPKYRRFLRYRYNNVPADRPGRYVYLRDEETGDFWSATWAPVEKPLAKFRYECRVGLNYQVVTSEYAGIETEVVYFVSPDHDVELWRFTARNLSGRARKLRAWCYAELNVWGAMRDLVNMDNNPRCTRVEWKDNTLIHSTWNDTGGSLGTQNWVRVYGYVTSSEKPAGYDTDRDMFLGAYRSEANPVVVETGIPNNHCRNGGLPVAAICHDLKLAPGKSKTIVYQMGVADDPREFRKCIPVYRKLAKVDAAFEKVKRSWDARLGKLQAKTPDADFDTVFNTWAPYQAVTTGYLSRSICSWKWGASVGLGFRDTSQDVMGCVHTASDLARLRLSQLLAVQYADGTAAHGFVPDTPEVSDRDFYDDHLWLVLSAANYVKETGDLSLLTDKVKFLDEKPAAGYEHLSRALDATMRLTGKHGLPKIGCADWNDGLVNPGDHNNESVFDAVLFCAACREFVALAEFLGKKADAVKYRRSYETMKARVNKHAWDGGWYRRVWHRKRGWMGAKGLKFGSIFVEPQPWAVLSGVADGKRGVTALDSVWRLLGTEYGIRLHGRPFEDYDPEVGAISIVLPGTKENGSVFHHPNPWVICAEAALGRGEKAMELLRRISPATKNRIAETHQVEPYVFCQWTGLPPFKHVGRGANPWLTGTASWVMVAMSQYILGLKPDYAGLRIDPCVPKSWNEFEVTRVFRGATFHISVRNPKGVEKGVACVTLDGRALEGNLVPAQRKGTSHEVEVTMG